MRNALILPLLFALAGCASQPARPQVALLGQQLQKQDADLIGQHFRTMLDFEHDADAAFVTGQTGMDAGHTGQRGLMVLPAASINVSSLLFGLTLPADWSLLGGYVRPTSGGRVTTTLVADGQIVAQSAREVPAGVWAFAAVDLTSNECKATLPTAKSVTLRIESSAGMTLDDVMLVDNRRTLGETENGWTIRQSGLSWTIHWPGRPMVRIASSAARADGWVIAEVNPLRFRLQDAAGRSRWTWLADGRSVLDGQVTANADGDSFDNPPQAIVDEATGRLDRESTGDTNNDGFNEQRGAYQITAAGPRLRVRLVPGAGQSFRSPLLEIRGLPPEARLVTMDGRWIEQTARLADGTLLVALPLKLESPVEVTVGVGE